MPFTDNLPSKSAIFDYWKERLREHGVFLDWGEPGCWACGFHYGAKYDIKQSNAEWAEILECWDRIPLQRCHIISRSLGGGDEASNLFLMCRECHDLAPNSTIEDVFLEWARRQSWDAREDAKYCAAFASFGVSGIAQAGLGELIISDGFTAWMSGRFGLHRPQSNYAPVSARLTPATVIGLAVHYQRAQAF